MQQFLFIHPRFIFLFDGLIDLDSLLFFKFISFFLFHVCHQVYPTKVRATGLGACSAVSRLGGVLAPVIAHLGGGLGMKVPLGIFAGFGLLGSILSILLPIETMGRKLEDTKV